MYKMIIVDDENGVREILTEFINNNDFGFEVSGSFSNAKRALEYLDTQRADLVLSDVKMPQISGIEFIEIVSQKYPAMHKVIISGYSEFEYAKAAIKYDVDNYLLKPIDYDEIGDVLMKIKHKLDEDKDRNKLVGDYLRMERESFFADLTLGAFSGTDAIERQYLKLNMKIASDNACGEIFEVRFNDIGKFTVENTKYDMGDINYIIENIVSNMYHKAYIIPLLNDRERFLYVYIEDRDNRDEFDIGYIEREIADITEADITVSSVKRFNCLPELAGAVSVEDSGEESLMLLVAHLRFGNREKAYNMLSRIVDSILSCSTTMKRKLMIDNVIEKVIGGLSPSSIDTGEDKMSEDDLIAKAIKYIDENYADTITRQDIAMQVYMSKSHFDKLFKLKTGKTIHDYLLEVRMSKAFELLKNGVPVYKICEMVGYKDKRNFLRMFKDYTGYTPSDFKSKVLNSESGGE